MKEENYKIGDKVLLRKDSKYYINNTVNDPRDFKGILLSYNRSDTLEYKVKWDNGNINWYKYKDLELLYTKDKIVNNYELY